MNRLVVLTGFSKISLFFYICIVIILSALTILVCPVNIQSQIEASEENLSDDQEEKDLEWIGDHGIYPLDNRTMFVQGGDPNQDTWESNSATGRGVIKFELLLYDKEGFDPDEPIKGQSLIWFSDCAAIGAGNPDILSLPWGDYPYGLWRCRINLMEGVFDPNRYEIKMYIIFEGQTDPLNALYCAQEYDSEKDTIYWTEYSRYSTLYSPVIGEQTIKITLSDAVDIVGKETVQGLGDRDPNQWVIDHIGGLLWPVPFGGRCFIVNN
ncbi:hypothetical protein JXL19_01755 [bacterium]|nr:hypothetical protein [bacterium]